MLRVLDPLTERFLSDLRVNQRRSSKASEEVSSGYRVNRPSDSPEDVVGILHILNDASRTSQIQSNLSRLGNEVNIAESTLQTAVNLLDKANLLGAQSLGMGQNQASREGIAAQIQQVLEQMLGLTQMNVQGRYIFSGDQDQTPQYTLDATNTDTGVARAAHREDTRQITDALGSTFRASKTAEEIFDHRNPDDSIADDNVFHALEQLRQALLIADDTAANTAITDAIPLVKQANDRVNSALSFYGSLQNRVADAMTIAQKYQVEWKQDLSELRDSDYAEAITALEMAGTHRDASLAAHAKFSGRSIFDYL